MFKMGDIITDFDNVQYVICSSVKYRGREYVYYAEKSNPAVCGLARVDVDGLKIVRNETLFNNIMNTLIKYVDFNGITNNLI